MGKVILIMICFFVIGACSKNHPIDDHLLTVPDNATAFAKQVSRICQKGNLPACHSLAYLYYDGKELPRDKVRANNLWQELCRRNHRVSCDYQILYFGNSNKNPEKQSQQRLAAFKTPPEKITSLSFVRKNLQSIPAEIFQLSNLTRLTLSYNFIRVIPAEIAQLKKLKELDLTGNHIETFPPEFAELVNLETLELSDNCLTEQMLGVIAQLPHLKNLHLNHCARSLPQDIGKLQSLESLELYGGGGMHDASALIQKLLPLKNLKKLDLSGLEIEKLPSQINQFKNLETLNLSYNWLEKLPEEFAELKSLKKIYLGFGYYPSDQEKGANPIELPSQIFSLNNLEFLWASQRIKNLPDQFEKLPHLKEIHISSKFVEEIPSSLQKLNNLQVINFANCSVKTLPDFLSRYKPLQVLKLYSNSELNHESLISFLQSQNLPNLEKLDLGAVRLNGLDEKNLSLLSKFKKLRHLNLQNNGLEKVPDFIKKMDSLRHLDLTQNHLKEIPEWLYETNLKCVHFVGNQNLNREHRKRLYDFYTVGRCHDSSL